MSKAIRLTHEEKGIEIDPGLIEVRSQMFGQFSFESQYFGVADAMVRSGSPDLAAKAMLGAVAKAPTDPGLWTWLGVTMADADGGMVSPAARAAFERGVALAPNHPGTHYFYALALLRMGQYPEGRAQLARALELAPPKMPYAKTLTDQLARVDAFMGGTTPPPAQPTPDAGAAGNAQAAPSS